MAPEHYIKTKFIWCEIIARKSTIVGFAQLIPEVRDVCKTLSTELYYLVLTMF